MWQTISYYAVLALESVVGVFGLRLYEEPTYEVIDRASDRVEIRRYAQRLAAEVTVRGTDEDARGYAFRLLFDYISGANSGASGPDMIALTVPVSAREPEFVDMTAPVESAAADGTMRMRFFLPAKYILESAPEPLDRRVQLVTMPAETIAAFRYSGSGRDSERRQIELMTILEDRDWEALGQPYMLYYDAPFTLPFVRRNEAAVSVVRR